MKFLKYRLTFPCSLVSCSLVSCSQVKAKGFVANSGDHHISFANSKYSQVTVNVE